MIELFIIIALPRKAVCRRPYCWTGNENTSKTNSQAGLV